MGILWSRRRRNDYHLQSHYPPPPCRPPLISSSTHFYAPQPPNFPPTHVPTPQSYSSHTNYSPNYANQGNWWPAINPPSQPRPPPPPPPYVAHQNAKKIKNDVNLHKDTLRVEVDRQNPDHYLVSFDFDALFDGSITIFYFGKEEQSCKIVPLYPEAYTPARIPFQKGLRQKFSQPSGTGIDLGFFELTDLSKPSPAEDVFPLVISAEINSPSASADKQSEDPARVTPSNMQITQAVLEKNSDGHFQARPVRQILCVDGSRYELREIYGIESSPSDGFDNNDSGKECVICMTEPKDTAVLPCRHMCLCSECAKELRLQSNKCPVCRQPIDELIGIKVSQ